MCKLFYFQPVTWMTSEYDLSTSVLYSSWCIYRCSLLLSSYYYLDVCLKSFSGYSGFNCRNKNVSEKASSDQGSVRATSGRGRASLFNQQSQVLNARQSQVRYKAGISTKGLFSFSCGKAQWLYHRFLKMCLSVQQFTFLYFWTIVVCN